jgi:hypothetical protein
MGALNKSGIDAEFRNRVEHLVEPGHSTVAIMSESHEKELAEGLTRQS